MSHVLQIFAKAPVPGAVKTRLIPPLDAVTAAALHQDLVERTLVLATDVLPPLGGRIELWCAPDCTHPFFAQCARRFPVTLRNQQGGDLGARMYDALGDALGRGDQPVLIGTDCPALDRTQIHEAFSALAPGRAHLVVLPTEDGGYALIGANRIERTPFENMAWGTDTVFEETALRISALGWALHRMATSWDVDRPEDLRRMQAEFPELAHAGRAG